VSKNLRSEVLRIASELPKGNETRRQLLSSVAKDADSNDILYFIVPQRTLLGLHSHLEKEGDDQSADLLLEVMSKLSKALSLSSGEEAALWRLKQVAEYGKRWDIGLLRNNIFKAADSLGIRLPSAMFASDNGERLDP